MRFETSQHMRLGQQMRLAPRMIQSMEILQMPLAELEERIEQELESNAALELVEPRGDARELADDRREAELDARVLERPLEATQTGEAEFTRLDEFESSTPDAMENAYSATSLDDWRDRDSSPRVIRGDEHDGKMAAMASTPARGLSLQEQLLTQWRLTDVSEDLRIAGEGIITFVDEDGLLRTPLATIQDRWPAESKPSLDSLERALPVVQQALDPPGIAARDVRECLLLQIAARERHFDEPIPDDLQIARWLVEDHLDDLTQNRWPRITNATGLSSEEIRAGVSVLRTLSLAPGRSLVERSTPAIVPDAIIEYDREHDRYVAYLNDARTMNLHVNRHYAMMTSDRTVDKRDRDFIRTNVSNAKWLIDAINQRRHTLLRVINVILEAQREFFDEGPQALRPLPMTDVAEQLGVHVATVSRAVADKWVLTPRGTFPLRGFFSGGLATDTGEEVSYDAVRAALKELIDGEDKGKPLSDERLVKELNSRGIEIARRTVAKYRDQLGIPPARLRKVHG